MTRTTCWLVIAAATLLACPGHDGPSVAAPAATSAALDPASVERVPPVAARARVQSGQALLVCAYADARCAQVRLEGSIPWSALEARLPGLPRDQEIILYCD